MILKQFCTLIIVQSHQTLFFTRFYGSMELLGRLSGKSSNMEGGGSCFSTGFILLVYLAVLPYALVLFAFG